MAELKLLLEFPDAYVSGMKAIPPLVCFSLCKTSVLKESQGGGGQGSKVFLTFPSPLLNAWESSWMYEPHYSYA